MKFVVTAPPYSDKSAGIVMLYLLRDELKGLGYDAEIMPFDKPITIPDDTIVIYPEVVDGNPLGAKNVVRYYLNREGLASGNKVNASPNDFILAFNKLYHDNPHSIVRYEDVSPHCYFGSKLTLNRKLDCTYIGKGSMYSDQCKVIEGTIEITRTAPAEKEGYADLLRQTRFLFSYDSFSKVNAEATLCGAIVVPLMFHPYKAEELEHPFASIVDNAVHIPPDYEQKRGEYISMFQSFNLAKQTESFAQKSIAHFSDSPTAS